MENDINKKVSRLESRIAELEREVRTHRVQIKLLEIASTILMKERVNEDEPE